ncbi:helix-turn-helix transcriptional regulator [uncultured Mobiluncus sp.]|uniref:helix-turn-helix domain-containing protein n=1 Tax=uncultured Mobiluncus sp. TaxID=293425 RepID=UPI0025EBBA53|nr:helix-turn-helix transcriptional regulator [uncultured Mobiluncus sp.]
MQEPTEKQVYTLARAQVRRDRQLIEALVKIRRAREQDGLTQKVVAERMGNDQSYISRFENLQVNPNQRTIRAYAIAIGAEIEYTVRPVPNVTVENISAPSDEAEKLWERVSRETLDQSPDYPTRTQILAEA